MMDIALKFNADMVVCDYILEYKKNKFVYQKGMKDACDAFDFLNKYIMEYSLEHCGIN